MTVHPIPPGTFIGKGVDIDLGENYGEALIYEPTQAIADDGSTSNPGQKIEFHLTQITSNQELTRSLNVSASASLGIGPFSGSAEAKYASLQQINRYSTYLLVSVTVYNSARIIRSPRLNPEAYTLLQNEGWDTFEQRYGPQYMAGVRTGGSYHALITINTTSKQEQNEISAAVSASYGTFKAAGKFNKELTEAIENKSLKITILQSGGDGDLLEVSLENMIEQAQNFPKLVKQNPVFFQGIFAEYRKTVPLPPSIGDSEISRIHRQAIMNELGKKYLKCKDYRADLRYVLDNFETFEEHLDLSPAERQTKITKYERDFNGASNQLNEIDNLARACRNSTEACQLPTSYFTPTEPLPNFDGENLMLKRMEEELAAVRLQVQRLQSELKALPNSDLNVRGTVSSQRGFRAGNDWEIVRQGEDLVIREPEQSDKIWARFKDDKHLHLSGTPDLLVDGKVGVGTLAD